MKTSAIVLAGGSGSRMHSNTKKQYMLLDGAPLISYCLKTMENSFIDEIILVASKEDETYVRTEIVEKYGIKKVSAIVEGGAERYDSVYNGLMAVSHSCDYVFIHDGARPFVTAEILLRTLEGARKFRACVAGMPVKDTIRIVDDDDMSLETPDRRYVWLMQTPQTFEYSLVQKAYSDLFNLEKKHETPAGITDDAMVVEHFSGVRAKMVIGDYNNIKITTPEDIATAQAILSKAAVQ